LPGRSKFQSVPVRAITRRRDVERRHHQLLSGWSIA
jgi:hypothetical protein